MSERENAMNNAAKIVAEMSDEQVENALSVKYAQKYIEADDIESKREVLAKLYYTGMLVPELTIDSEENSLDAFCEVMRDVDGFEWAEDVKYQTLLSDLYDRERQVWEHAVDWALGLHNQ